MARDFSSEAAFAFAVGASLAALASAVVLLVSIAALRAWRRWRAWRLARREEAWRAALHQAIDDPAGASLPRIDALELADFVTLWNHLRESLRGEAAENLAAPLRRAGVDARVLAMLGRHSQRLKLIAATALGHLREPRAWEPLLALARSPGAVLSFAAARALLRIDARRALAELAPDIAERHDWPLARVGSLFEELGPDVVTPPVIGLLVSARPAGLERALKLARFAHRGRIAAVVRGWLNASGDPEVLVAALDFVEDAEDLAWVRGAARHEDWRVRAASARALARIGGRGELATLLELLSDPVWWVRYRASQAVIRLHGLTAAEVEELRHRAADAFASDMLAHALAERMGP